MLNVNGVPSTTPPAAIQPTGKTAVSVSGPVAAGPGPDVVEISTAARLAAKVHDVPPVREDLVARVKAEIAAGVYETPQRFEIAIDRLMEDIYPDI